MSLWQAYRSECALVLHAIESLMIVYGIAIFLFTATNRVIRVLHTSGAMAT